MTQTTEQEIQRKAKKLVCQLDECFSLKPSFSSKAVGIIVAALRQTPILETSDGRRVHILKTNARGKYPVVALYEEPEGYDMVWLLTAEGEFWSNGVHVKTNDVRLP